MKLALCLPLCFAGLGIVTAAQARIPADEKAREGKLGISAYCVSDLVEPMPANTLSARELGVYPLFDSGWETLPRIGRYQGGADPLAVPCDAEMLLRIIRCRIEPDCWEEVGGKCTVRFCPLGAILEVSAPVDVQKEVVEMLENLRAMHILQAECKMVEVGKDGKLHSTKMPPLRFVDEPKAGIRQRMEFASTPVSGDHCCTWGLLIKNSDDGPVKFRLLFATSTRVADNASSVDAHRGDLRPWRGESNVVVTQHDSILRKTQKVVVTWDVAGRPTRWLVVKTSKIAGGKKQDGQFSNADFDLAPR